MKKIFTLLTMALLAIGAQAQTISWTADDVCSKGSAKASYSNGTFVLNCTDTDKNKHEIDANPAYFGDVTNQVKFDYRLKTSGKSSSKNALSLTIPSSGTLKVYVRTGSNSDATRNLVLTQSGSELYNAIVKEADAILVKGLDETNPDNDTKVYPVISVSVVAGTVDITYPVNGLNFYGFEFVSGGGEEPQAVDVEFSLSNDEIFTDETSQIAIKGKSGLDGLTMSNLAYDESVISIDETGKITPVAVGTSAITFTTAAVDGKYNAGSASLSITVKEREIPEEIDFPTTTEGISCKGTTAYSSEAVKIKKTNVPGYKFNNSGIENAIVLTVKDGFKVGDVVTVAGVLYSGNTSKSAVIQLFQAEDGSKVWETDDLNEVKNIDTAEPTEGSYTLEAASDKLYLVRNSGTTGSAASCFAVKIKVARGSETGIVELPVTIENNGAIYNLSGQRVDENYRGVVIKNGKKQIQK